MSEVFDKLGLVAEAIELTMGKDTMVWRTVVEAGVELKRLEESLENWKKLVYTMDEDWVEVGAVVDAARNFIKRRDTPLAEVIYGDDAIRLLREAIARLGDKNE